MAVRPGLYITFINSAELQIAGGAKGIVALPLRNYSLPAVEKTFYSIKDVQGAIDLFGEANVQAIKLILQGGAKEVLVYTLPVIDGTIVTEEAAVEEALLNIETRDFHAIVFDGEVSAISQDFAKTWVAEKRAENKHFFLVTGGTDTDDQDIAIGNARSIRLADDYIINLVSGGVLATGETLNSSELASYICGLIASSPLNRSLTYMEAPLVDVTKRFRNSEIVSALEAGSLVLWHDGELVRIEQGLTTSKKKIRSVASRQAISTDISKTVNSQYIGKLNNTPDSRKALISAIKAYLERLEVESVLTDIDVVEDPANPSTGDTVNLSVGYLEVDSMEKINLGINVTK